MNEHERELSSIEAPTSTERKSGRAVFDNDGRSVWEWQTATGVFTRNVTDDQLTMLSTVELEIEETSREAENAKVFTGTRRPLPTKIASRRARGSAHAKKQTRGVTAWLMRGWLADLLT